MAADFSRIKAFVFDVDGVMTDGGVWAIPGDLVRKFNAKDCFALRMAAMHGYHLGCITGGISTTIPMRLKRCGFAEEDVYLGSRDKMEQITDFCTRHQLSLDELAYCGDDIPDVGPLKACGVGACPSGAVPEAKAVADYISDRDGGEMFVRALVEEVLRSHGNWSLDVSVYKERF